MTRQRRIAPVFRPDEKGLRKVFGELEASIMECLWAQGHGTVSDVYRALTTQREVAYTTVKTVMERLAEKGYLHCNSQQRAYVYTPVQGRDDFLRQVSDAVLSGLLQDFDSTAAAHLVEETIRQCDAAALERLQALIDARRAEERSAQETV